MKRVAVLVAIVAVGAVSVSAAQADVSTNETVSYAWSGWVSCANGGAGEFVTGRIDVHNLVTATENDNVYSWQFQFQPRGGLIGRNTGDTYQLTGVSRGSYTDGVQSGMYTLTYVNRYQLIGSGSGNNLYVRETAHMTIDGDDLVVQHDDFAIECG